MPNCRTSLSKEEAHRIPQFCSSAKGAAEILAGAEAIERALALTVDWRVRSALADAATIVRAAHFIQQKIDAGQLKAQSVAPQPGDKAVRAPIQAHQYDSHHHQ